MLNPKGPYLSVEKEKDNFCVVFTNSIKRACEIWIFHVAGVQRRQRNEQNSMMHVQICCFVNKNLLLFCRSFSLPLSLVLLSYRNSATMVMWRHTSSLYCSPVGDVTCKFFLTDQRAKKVVPDSPGLVDFAIGLVMFVLNLRDAQVLFFGEIQITEGLLSILPMKKGIGASWNDLWASTCYATACPNGRL